MQPYLFPYIGYLQLLNAVDKFVILDDVNFINRGWVNRNRILVNGLPHLFTVPLKDASQNKLIKDLEIVVDEKWKNKFLKTLAYYYKKAPYFNEAFLIVKVVITTETRFLIDWHLKSLDLIKTYLDVDTIYVKASTDYDNRGLKGEDRIIDICIREKADHYINPIGGLELYDSTTFLNKGIKMSFLESNEISYQQFNSEFVPSLSIIDAMMFNSSDNIKNLLKVYVLYD